MHKGDHVLLTSFTYVPLIKYNYHPALYFQACKEKPQLPVAHLTLVKKGGFVFSGANFPPLFSHQVLELV